MRNILFYLICALIAVSPAFAAGKKVETASDEMIAQARLAAQAEESTAILGDEANTSLTVNEQQADTATTTEVAASTSEEASSTLTQEQMMKMKESEIPLAGANKAAKKSEGSPWFRLLSTIGVVGLLFAGATYGLKRYGKRSNSKTQTTKIRVITNHHLGPKKSLMIVNVAGESLLLGVTDHNINILKNLSLLDEELPADVPKTFANAINESFVDTDMEANNIRNAQQEDEQIEDFAVQGLAAIKDKVSSRLKNMRQI